MISLSSIVKAKSSYIYPGNEDIDMNKAQSDEKVPAGIDASKEIILEQAIRKSRHIYDEAMKRANAIVENAEAESFSIQVEAEQRGYRDGYTRGLQDGAKEARRTSEDGLMEIESLIIAIKKERKEALERQKKELLMIAFEIAKKVMKQHIEADENAIAKMLEDIIFEHETGVKIFLPEYSKTLNVAIDKGTAKKIQSAAKNVKVVMTQNDDFIMVETENGVVDMSIPVQLDQLQDAMGLD